LAKKKASRKTVSKKKASDVVQGIASLSVSLQKAKNGFVVRSWGEKLAREVIYIAKTKQEAKGYIDKIMKV